MDRLPRYALGENEACTAARLVEAGRFTTVLGGSIPGARSVFWLWIAGGANAIGFGVDTFGSDLDTARPPTSRSCTATCPAPGLASGPAIRRPANRCSSRWAAGGWWTSLCDGWGGLRGEVRDAITGAPLAGIDVSAYSEGSGVGYTATGADGRYQLVLLPGTVVVATSNFDGYRDEVFDDVPCGPSGLAGCDLGAGRELVVGGGFLDGIDFDLDPPGTISGTVRDAVTQAPVPQPRLGLSPGGFPPSFVHAGDSQGRFQIAVPTGSYLVAAGAEPYQVQLHDGIACPWQECDLAAGTKVDVLPGAVRSIDFALVRLGTISGRVHLSGLNGPSRSLCDPYVRIYDAALREVSTSYCFFDDYVSSGLEPGSYYVLATAFGYRGEVWDDVPCDSPCNLASGTPVPVALGEAVAGIDLTLQRLGSIAGTVTDTASGEPLAGVELLVYDTGGDPRTVAVSDRDGRYQTLGLPAGSYHVVADSSAHHDELYDDLPCPSSPCDLTGGTLVPVVLEQTTDGIDFALRRAAVVSGTVRSLSTGEGVPFAGVEIFEASGLLFALATTNVDGTWSVTILPAGVYWAAAFHADHQRQLYDGIPCEECDETTGSPIVLAAGATATGIDFLLPLRGRGVFGHVRDDLSGRPLRYVLVDFWRADGSLMTSRQTGIDGFFDLGLEFFFGPLFVSTDNGRGAIDQVHAGIECPEGPAFTGGCDPRAGTPVHNHPNGARVDFRLRGLSLFVDGFESGDSTAWSALVPP